MPFIAVYTVNIRQVTEFTPTRPLVTGLVNREFVPVHAPVGVGAGEDTPSPAEAINLPRGHFYSPPLSDRIISPESRSFIFNHLRVFGVPENYAPPFKGAGYFGGASERI